MKTELHTALKKDLKLARKPQLVVDAARHADLDALKLLVKHGADINAAWRGYRPLHALIQEKPHGETGRPSRQRLECLDWLLAHGADPDQLGAWPPARALLIAAFAGIEAFVERLRKESSDDDAFAACALGDFAAIKHWVKRNPDFVQARDAGGLTGLQCAAASRLGHRKEEIHRQIVAIARLLLDAGADPNAMTRSWSHDVDTAYFAASAHNLEIFELLLARGADPTAALPSALWNAPIEFADAALKHGADINRAVTKSARSSEARPLLTEMVRWGQMRQTFWLLDHGADPNLPDEQGWTSVHQAASRGNERIFRAILEAGGDLGRRDAAGLTPMDIARSRGRTKLAAIAVAYSR